MAKRKTLVPIWTLGLPESLAKTSRRPKKLHMARVRGAASDSTISRGRKSVKLVRNPWAPETINELIGVLVLSYPIWKDAVGWLRDWMKLRKASEIRIRVSGNELIVKGYMRASQLEKVFEEFNKQVEGASRKEIKITLPKGVTRSFPRKLTIKRKRKKP